MAVLSAVPRFEVLKHVVHPCCKETLCSLHERDELYRRPMKIIWSMNQSEVFHGELPAPSQHTKDVVLTEAAMLLSAKTSGRNGKVSGVTLRCHLLIFTSVSF